MSVDCFCDYDPPEFFSKAIRTARKEHRCYECGGKIVAGEQYEYVAGKWDGDFDCFATCERCVDIRTWVTNSVPCFCWAHGSLIDDAREAIDAAQDRAPEETRGLRFRLERRIQRRNKFNRARAS